MLIRLTLLSAVFEALAVSSASAAPAAQPMVSITDKHLHTSVGTQTLQVAMFSAVPVTDVLVFCEVSSRLIGDAVAFSTGLSSLDGTGTFALPWVFSKGDKTLASCNISYTDSTSGLGGSTGPFDLAISVGG